MKICNAVNYSCPTNHRLKLECKGEPYRCNGCKELGFGSRYTCNESCDYHLHKDCASPPLTIFHPIFKHCNFKFSEAAKSNRCCDACGMAVNGYVYHCNADRCVRDLHPCCANLQDVIEDGEVKLVLRRKVSSKCYRCGKKKLQRGNTTWSYVSTCKVYHIHVACVKEMLLENWKKKECLGGDDDHSQVGGEADPNDDITLAKKTPLLQLVVRNDKSGSKSSKFKKIVKTVIEKTANIVITSIIAAILGDPTTIT